MTGTVLLAPQIMRALERNDGDDAELKELLGTMQ